LKEREKKIEKVWGKILLDFSLILKKKRSWIFLPQMVLKKFTLRNILSKESCICTLFSENFRINTKVPCGAFVYRSLFCSVFIRHSFTRRLEGSFPLVMRL